MQQKERGLMYPKTLRRFLKANIRPEQRLTRGTLEKFNELLLEIALGACKHLRESEYSNITPQDVDAAFKQYFASQEYRQRIAAVKTVVASLQAALAEAAVKIENL